MMYRAMLDHPGFTRPRPPRVLRRAVYAMAPMPDDLIGRSLTGFGCDFALLFGQTEMSPCTTLFRPEHQLSHLGAVGTPLVGVQVAVMGQKDGALLPPGQAGEIVYRGPSTMSGYLHDEEATGRPFAHGWFHSGDVGHFERRRRAVVRRPAQGRDQDRRRERRLDRGGEGDLRRRSAGSRTGRGRPAARALERGDHRVRRAQARRDDRPRGADRRAEGTPRPLQDAEGGHPPVGDCPRPPPARSRRTSCAPSTRSTTRRAEPSAGPHLASST